MSGSEHPTRYKVNLDVLKPALKKDNIRVFSKDGSEMAPASNVLIFPEAFSPVSSPYRFQVILALHLQVLLESRTTCSKCAGPE